MQGLYRQKINSWPVWAHTMSQLTAGIGIWGWRMIRECAWAMKNLTAKTNKFWIERKRIRYINTVWFYKPGKWSCRIF